MKLTHLGTESGDTGCPSAFATDRGTFVLQGWRVTDPEALAHLRKRGLPDHETAVEIPAALLRHLPEDVVKLSRSEFQELFDGDWSSAWRWECQGVYHEPHEQEPLRRFLAGEPDDLSWYRWPSRVRTWVAAGRSIGRVRMLTDPLTDYLRFEQQALTPPAVDAGEDIRYVSQRRATEAGAPTDDFWLFDDTTAVVMTFDEDGVSGGALITDPATVRRYVAWRDEVSREAAP